MAGGQQALLGGGPTPPQPLSTFTFGYNAAAFTLAWPASHAANDIGILLVATANEVLATPSGWNPINTPIGTAGPPGDALATRIYAFWKRAASGAEADASIGDSGVEQQAVMFVLRGCDVGASPIEAVTGDALTTAAAGATVPSTTTLGNNRYVVGASSNAVGGTTTNNATCVWTTNAALDNFIELADFSVLNGQQIGAFGGSLTLAGATGTTAATFSQSGRQERVIFAVKPIGG
jgi:hypothetical protein